MTTAIRTEAGSCADFGGGGGRYEAQGLVGGALSYCRFGGHLVQGVSQNWRVRLGRRQSSREFKLEAIHLVRKRGVSVAQAGRDLDFGENGLRRWIEEASADPRQAFPGQGQLRPEQSEIDRLPREVAKLKAERDILKKPPPTSRGSRHEVQLRYETSSGLGGAMASRDARCLA